MRMPIEIKTTMYESKILDKFAKILPSTIFIASGLLYVIYLILFFGLTAIDSSYINYLHTGIQFVISLFLIIRFHPFRTHVLEPQDSAVIFSASIFLLTSLGLSQYIYYITKDKLKKYASQNIVL